MSTETIGANGRGLWRFYALTAGVLFGGPIELETRGDLREWMAMSEGERLDALSASWSSGLRRQREMAGEGPPPSRQARTSLGFGLLGSWAPPDGRWHSDTFRLAMRDGRTIYVDANSVPLVDGKWVLFAPVAAADSTKGKEDG